MPRTRSESAHKKVIRAALELVAERGVESASMDAIAAQSGVSKATIYKHWPDKDALVLEAMGAMCGLTARPVFDTGNTREDMVAVLAYRPRENSRMRERILPQFVAYSATHQEFGNAWRNMVMEPPRRELRRLLEHAEAKGEIHVDIDPDVCLAILLGPLMYWHIFLRHSTSDSRPIAEGVVEAFWRAFGSRKAGR
jgi:AcrR family transcriptional regulator